jgi:PAS domain S-box-containing protein
MQGEAARGEYLRHLELVAQNTSNMVVVTNGNREIEWVNPAYTKVTGWSLEEVRGKNPKTFLHGPRTSLTAASRLGAQLRKGQAVTDFEMLNYKKSGEPYWVSLNIQPVANDAGEITQFVAIESDITQRKRAEQDAAKVLHQLAEAQRLAKLGLMEHDLSTGELRCSPEIYRILDAQPGEIEPSYEGVMSHLHPENDAAVRAAYERAINGGEPYEAEFRLVGKTGCVKWVHARGALEGWDDGRHALFRVVIQDITERKDAEQLQRDKELLQQASCTQMEVLSRISHELRTPLHAVLGFAENLDRAEGARMAERSRGQLSHIRDSAKHLLLLVNDILDLTRLHGGVVPFDLQAVDVQRLARDVMAMVEPLAALRGVTVRLLPAAPALLYAQADGQRLKQVLINLLSNAIKYNRPDGHVDIRLRGIDADGVSIAVTDTGIGIAEADQVRLFEPFYRVAGEAQLQVSHESSGLGLAIARSLAQGMGGDVTVDSRLGEGSTFVLTLRRGSPSEEAQRAAAKPAVLPSDRPVADNARGTVLYIEDNELNCLLLETYLAQHPSIELRCCATGVAGLTLARQIRPSLILVDMGLPDLRGAEVMQIVLNDPVLYRTPCVAFSADNDEDAIEAAIRSGFREYWPKPMSRTAVLDALERLLADEPLKSRF